MVKQKVDGTQELWLSSLRMTVWVRVDTHGVVRDAAPVVGKFVGQPVENLKRWLKRHGGYREVTLR